MVSKVYPKNLRYAQLVLTKTNKCSRRTGMLDIDTTKEQIEGKGGLILAGKLAELMGIKGIASPIIQRCREVLTQLFGALVQGEPGFEAIRPFRESELIQKALGLDTALSAETVRIYAGEMTETPEPVDALRHRYQSDGQQGDEGRQSAKKM
jgi:hypothetical protein